MTNMPYEKVKKLYERLQSGTLAPDDIIPSEMVKYDNHGRFIVKCRTSKTYFQKIFSGFSPTYDVFRIFDDPTSVVLDVGAHTGYSAVAMRHNGCQGKIISIDAIPSNVDALRELKLIEGASFDCVHMAISENSGSLRLYLPVMNGHGITALASTGDTLTHTYDGYIKNFADLAAQFPSSAATGEHDTRLAILEIEADNLDHVLQRKGITFDQVVAVKLDLEGHEAPAVRGSEQLFTRQQPLLMVEGANRDPELCRAMERYGYFHCERRDGLLVPHPEISLANDGFWVHPARADGYRKLGLLRDVQDVDVA